MLYLEIRIFQRFYNAERALGAKFRKGPERPDPHIPVRVIGSIDLWEKRRFYHVCKNLGCPLPEMAAAVSQTGDEICWIKLSHLCICLLGCTWGGIDRGVDPARKGSASPPNLREAGFTVKMIQN